MSVLTLILAGGAGSRLSILGEKRAKPSMPFAGKYRIIDFPLSNAVNSDLYRIAVLTQFRPHSMVQHMGIGEPWDLNRRPPNGLQIWQPFRGRTDQDWYRGTADALYQNRGFIREDSSDTLLVLSGDHVYKQDYRDMLRFHQDKGADLTVAVMNVRQEETSRLGIMTVDAGYKITRFVEKPKHSESTLASMGIYVFNKQFLLQQIEADTQDKNSAHDFGKNIIPRIVEMGRAFAYPFIGYWVDVGTIQAYWETSMALLAENPPLDLYDSKWVIHTRSEERPPVKCIPPGELVNSMASNGCIINGTVMNSVLSPGVRVEKGAVVRDSVILNDTVIRAGALVDRCILDKQIEVGAGAQLGVGAADIPNEVEPANLHTGITIVGKRARIPAGVIIGRNCRIDSDVTQENFHSTEIPGGRSVCKTPECKGETA
jgi:glucose-1-phosphate adenylyltransferase